MENIQLGYTQPLFIMAFDHRASFAKNIFGIESEEWGAEQLAQIRDYKHAIFEGLLKAIDEGVPKDRAGVLEDELTGDLVLKDATAEGIATILTVEKSGQEEFQFEYGQQFMDHINKYHPTFTKALVRYNPDGNTELNHRQREKLRQLSDFSHQNGYKFLIEPIIGATTEQLASVGGDKHRYDNEVRAGLTVRMIAEMNADGVNPDIWKIEGLNSSEDYEKIVAQARSGGRENVSIVVLGRGESDEGVEAWLKAGKTVPGVIGFAIGRTIFQDTLIALHRGEIDRATAVNNICQHYTHFYKVFRS